MKYEKNGSNDEDNAKTNPYFELQEQLYFLEEIKNRKTLN